MTRFAIGLGSNLGDRLAHLTQAQRALAARFDVVATSSVYETAPIGGPDQDPFLNAIVVVTTHLSPQEVLFACQEIEEAHQRERTVRWGPRTLDLDIIASDAGPHRDGQLTVPHPRAVAREFVLRPLCEVWPDAPVGPGLSAEQALSKIDDQGVDLLATDWIAPMSTATANLLLAGQLALIAGVAIGIAYDGSVPEGGFDALRVLGVLIALVGAVLGLWAGWHLGPFIAARPIPKPGAELVTSGPYRFARHPIYGGVILVLTGVAVALASLAGLIVAIMLVPYFLLKASYEERQLRMRYPGYRGYRVSVRQRLIPFVV